MAWMIFSFSVHQSFFRSLEKRKNSNQVLPRGDRICFWLFYASLGLLLGGFASRHEFGIPIFFVLSILIWGWLEQHPTILSSEGKRLFTFINVVSPVLLAIFGLGGSYLYVKFNEGKAVPGLIGSIANKVSRFSTSEGMLTDFIRQAGWFGTSNYLYNFAANNDYSLGLQIRTFGLVWLFILAGSIGVMLWKGLRFLAKSRDYWTVLDILKSLSFFSIFVLLAYPLLANVGRLPIIGVSPYASGYSIMHSILSAMLLLFTLFERRWVDEI